MNSADKRQKIDDILKRLVYGDVVDINERERLENLHGRFQAAVAKSQIATTEPVQVFIDELQRDIAEINMVLIDKLDLDADERKALIYLRGRIDEWITFWTGAKANADSIGRQIDEEWQLKAKD